ncbi:MAG: bifunctional heptose 7-phosphate kinase/heptose 1-phosphate adenyltransferase [Planctomycetes bacterium]|nr:bifunctional heptose 7-phosphate kinase/heptose 1-phosphate adenyltransferase [Planctomycetota bacterium]
MQRLVRLVRELSSPSILVVGDLILDRYVEGNASRVSPEAPVLVFEKQDQRLLLGGACNVAANLVGLGARASVLGVIGTDSMGATLRELLTEGSIDTTPVVVDASRPTTLKTRYVSKTAQVLRVDTERRHSLEGPIKRQMLDYLGQRPFPHEAVLLSDYGKGVLDREVIEAAIAAAHSNGGIIVVDPKGTDYEKYRGVDILTPNREEAIRATGIEINGLDDLNRAATRLREITGVPAATITLGKDGIYFEAEKGESRIIPTEAKAVFDVTGAGDTVVAALTLARACGASLEDSVRFANVAAGIVVGRFGTWAVSRTEILTRLGQQSAGKILTLDEAISVAGLLRTEGRRLVFTNGCFDILHAGHTDYLARAKTYGDALMVGINTDESVRALGKGDDRPINRLEDRCAVLAALAAVTYVVPFGDETPLQLIKAVTPHVLVKGEDWRDKGVVGEQWVSDHGGTVVLLPLRPGCSTTETIERVRTGRRG